jgi:transketolase N-terminal domain/subunit
MADRSTLESLEARAAKLREHVVTVASAQPAHLGGSMSCADLMAALFFHALRLDEGETRDHFLLSKGHGGLARVGVDDVFCTEIAPHEDLLRIHGLDADGIGRAVRGLVAG